LSNISENAQKFQVPNSHPINSTQQFPQCVPSRKKAPAFSASQRRKPREGDGKSEQGQGSTAGRAIAMAPRFFYGSNIVDTKEQKPKNGNQCDEANKWWG